MLFADTLKILLRKAFLLQALQLPSQKIRCFLRMRPTARKCRKGIPLAAEKGRTKCLIQPVPFIRLLEKHTALPRQKLHAEPCRHPFFQPILLRKRRQLASNLKLRHRKSHFTRAIFLRNLCILCRKIHACSRFPSRNTLCHPPHLAQRDIPCTDQRHFVRCVIACVRPLQGFLCDFRHRFRRSRNAVADGVLSIHTFQHLIMPHPHRVILIHRNLAHDDIPFPFRVLLRKIRLLHKIQQKP